MQNLSDSLTGLVAVEEFFVNGASSIVRVSMIRFSHNTARILEAMSFSPQSHHDFSGKGHSKRPALAGDVLGVDLHNVCCSVDECWSVVD